MLHLPVRVDPAHVQEPCLPVDVAALETDPFFGSEPCPGCKHDDRGEPRADLVGGCVDLLPGGERPYLPSLRFRVRHLDGDVALDEVRPDGVAQDLPERLVDLPGGPLGQPSPPGGDLAHVEAVDRHGAECVLGVAEPVAEVRDRVVLGDVLGEELVDQIGESEVAAWGKRQAAAPRDRDVAQLLLEPRLRRLLTGPARAEALLAPSRGFPYAHA